MRRLIAAVVLAGLLLGVPAWTLSAAADDELPPPVYPSGLPDPGDIGNDVPDGGYTPGPTIVITPGSTGTALPRPTTSAPAGPGDPGATSTATTPGTPGSDPAGAGADGGPFAPGSASATPLEPPADGSPVWLAVAAGLIVLLGLVATFGGIVRERVTRDPASR